MPLGRASSHGGAVNLVRSGTKQPQPFSTSAEGQARPPSSVFSAAVLSFSSGIPLHFSDARAWHVRRLHPLCPIVRPF